MIKILFFQTYNRRASYIESLIIELSKKNHKVEFLTSCSKGDIHFFLESKNIETYSLNEFNKLKIFYKLYKFLIKEKYDLLFSNYQEANIISLPFHYISKTKVVLFRHHYHFIEGVENQFNISLFEKIYDFLINKFCSYLVVPSKSVYNSILINEKINQEKLFLLPYIYNFEETYEQINFTKVKEIKLKYSSELLILFCSRLIDLKRPFLVLEALNIIFNSYKKNIKLIILGDGELKQKISEFIFKNNLENNVFLLGYIEENLEYIKASDILIQPSLTDASNNVAKEFALLEKTLIVCKGVADYEEYINKSNGFLIEKNITSHNLAELLINISENKEQLDLLGKRLKISMLRYFDNKNSIIEKYENFIKTILKIKIKKDF